MSSPGSGSKRSREAGSEAVAEEAPAAAWAAAPQPPSAQQAAALVAELAAAEAQATNEPAALAERARLYLPRDGLLESTNARVVAANGTQLPVHSQILKVAAKEVEEELEGEPEGTPVSELDTCLIWRSMLEHPASVEHACSAKCLLRVASILVRKRLVLHTTPVCCSLGHP